MVLKDVHNVSVALLSTDIEIQSSKIHLQSAVFVLQHLNLISGTASLDFSCQRIFYCYLPADVYTNNISDDIESRFSQEDEKVLQLQNNVGSNLSYDSMYFCI